MNVKVRHGLLVLLAVLFIVAAPTQVKAAYKSTAETVCSTKTNVHLRSGPGLNYSVKDTLRKGQHVTKVGVSGSWSAIKINNSIAYIKSCYLKKQYKYMYVSGSRVNLRLGPGTNYPSYTILSKNTRLKCKGRTGDWMKIKYQRRTCYISRTLVSSKKATTVSSTPNSTNTSASSQSALSIKSKAISIARTRLGDTYSQAKRNLPGYADCSSLLRDIFLSAAGVNIGETTSAQISILSSYKKSLSDLQPGDILMRIEPGSNHVAIYIGNNQYIHASSTRGQVITSTYYPGVYWTCCYDAAAYCCSRR